MEKRQALSVRKLFVLLLSFLMMIGVAAPNMEVFAVENTTTDLNLANLNLYEFKCRQENMQVVSTGSGTLKEVVTPNGSWTKSTVFMHKYEKSNSKQDYDNVLELLFTNAGEVNGKKVNVRVKVSHLQLNPTVYYGQQANFNDANAGVPFLTVDQNWGDSGIQLMDYVYPDHPNFTNDNIWSFNTKTDVTATLEYADGTPCDLKLTMQPADIDVKPGNPIAGNRRSSFYEELGVKNLDSTIDKIVYNRAVSLDEENGSGNWHWWKANASITAAGTSGQDEYNKTGFVMRSKTNSITFAYNSSVTSGGLFKFFAEVPYHNNPGRAAKKTVDKAQAPKRVGEPINYTVRYTVPRPGTDIIDDIKSLKFADTFDKKVDFKEAIVKFDGNTLVEGQDYRVTVTPDNENGQDHVEINIIKNALFARDKGGKVYEITYKTETNSRALVEGDNTITNSAAKMYFDNVSVPTNTVETKLLPPTKPKKDVFKDDMSTSVDGKTVKGGDVLTYKITYKNTIGRADDVTITDAIPKYTKYVSGSADNGGVEQNGVITWRKTNLGNDETFTVTYKVKVDEDINGKPVDNQAKVSTNYYKFETNKTHNPTPVMPKKPVVNKHRHTPKTGDSNGLLPYSIALVGSALAAFGLFAARKRIAR